MITEDICLKELMVHSLIKGDKLVIMRADCRGNGNDNVGEFGAEYSGDVHPIQIHG